MLGPALQVRGGISAVERMLLAALSPRAPHVAVSHVATMREGSKAAKLATFLRALASAWRHTGRRAAQRADIVHIHFASRASSVRKMALARLALARGCRLIMHAHGGAYPDYWKTLSAARRRRNLDVLRRADALIVLGETWREFFAGVGVPVERIVVMPNPVVLPPAPARRSGAAAVVFVYLGLVSGSKGSFDLIEAIARLRPQTRARLRLVIAGNGDHAELGRRIAQHGLGSTIEVHAWLDGERRDALLASAEAFVLPSYHEGLPMALLEAMAWGLAPVATPVGAIPEVLQHEDNGLLVAPGDIDALARAIERLALDRALRARLGEAARRRVEPLAIENYARQLGELYEAVKCRN
jgi:glycosyltransferase involved in cell wall biosynthesis